MPIAIKRLMIIGLSFCLGLLVFYMPGRQYTSLHQVWLPNGLSSDRDDVLSQPISSWPNDLGGIRFVPTDPAGPSFIEINADATSMKPQQCPDLFEADAQSPTKCTAVGTIGDSRLYGFTPRASSPNMYIYYQLDQMLVAVTGFSSADDAAAYLKAFGLVARRDVATQLKHNKSAANAEVADIQREKQAANSAANDAYKHLPFTPVLPSILPAGWMQKMVRIDGADPRHPTAIDIFYRKGDDRTIILTIVAAKDFQLGSTCGPLPSDATSVACSKVADKDYYQAGSNTGNAASWYIFRQIGDAVAIVEVSEFAEGGHPPVLLNRDLDVQASIAQSLRATDVDSFKGASFMNHGTDKYPWVKP